MMKGDYHDSNAAALGKVRRLLNGDFNEILDAHNVVGNVAPDAKEIIMAKKAATGQFEGMEDETPQELIDMAKLYKKEQCAEAKAKARTKATKGAIIQKMSELKVTRFRVEVEGNMKWLTLKEEETIRWEKSETGPSDGGDE